MFRSQNIPARYAIGTVKASAIEVANWLGVKNIDLAAAILDDQGIRNAALSPDRQFIEFEHVWVQASIPYAEYRGAVASAIDCSVSPLSCDWVDLDPSFKVRRYLGQSIAILDPLSFDYDRYYRAIKNNDPAFLDKNPLEIYEKQILAYLRTRPEYAGKTLDDVADPGEIMQVRDGLLPASLPYEVVGVVRHYDSVAEHDDSGAENGDGFI